MSSRKNRSDSWFSSWPPAAPKHWRLATPFYNIYNTRQKEDQLHLLCVESLLNGKVGGESSLVGGQAPDAQVVDLVDALQVQMYHNDSQQSRLFIFTCVADCLG